MKKATYGKLVFGLMLTQPAMLLVAQPQEGQPWDNQAPPMQQGQQFNQEQLSALVAPIALYPDALLSQVLVAATYPRELQQAAQWVQSMGNLGGSDLVAAASQQPWDASIQALVVFPDVLQRLASNIQWTTDLGNAFLAQQGDVMGAVQILRAQARNSGRLTSTAQQNVVYQDQGIEIQPTDPSTVYVPNYDPQYIWGAPAYGYYYPPLYYPRAGFSWGFGVSIGRSFGGLGWGGWGWRPNWYGRTVIQNNYFVTRYRFNGYSGGGRYYASNSGTWAHNPDHRMGVPYSGRGFSGGAQYNVRGYSGGGRGQSYQVNQGSSRGFSSANTGSNRYQSANAYQTPSRSGSYNNGGGRSNSQNYQTPSPSYNTGGGRSNSQNYQTPSPSYNTGGGRSNSQSYQTPSPSYNTGGGRSNSQNYQTPSPSYNTGGRSNSPSYQTPSPSYNSGGRSNSPSYQTPSPSYNSGGHSSARSYNNYGGGRSASAPSASYQPSQHSTQTQSFHQPSGGSSNYQATPRGNFGGGDSGSRPTPSSRQSSPSGGGGGRRGR